MQVYVGTYGKYNSGSIEGAWLDLEDYSDKDEFLEACKKLHSDEDDPELMFQDFDGAIINKLASESNIPDELFEIDEYLSEDAIAAYLSLFGEWNRQDFEDKYYGEFSSPEEFAREWAALNGFNPDELPYWIHIDWEATARDLLCDPFCAEGDHYFFR